MAAALELPQATAVDVVQVAKAVGDDLRSSILRLLAHDSFGVLELCAILEVAQPKLSHHLKVLSAARLVARQRDGTNVFYRRVPAHDSELLAALFGALDARPVDARTQRLIDEVYGARVRSSERFFATHAQALETQSELICEPSVYVPAVVDAVRAGVTRRTSALEVGPGSGELMLALAQLFDHVVGIDSSEQMLTKTARAIEASSNVELVRRDFLKLPRSRKHDAVIAAMVVHHMPSPRRFFDQARRVLRPSGALVVAELCAHTQAWVKELCGDLWLGFEAAALQGWAAQAGFVLRDQQFLAQRNGFCVQISHFNSPD